MCICKYGTAAAVPMSSLSTKPYFVLVVACPLPGTQEILKIVVYAAIWHLYTCTAYARFVTWMKKCEHDYWLSVIIYDY